MGADYLFCNESEAAAYAKKHDLGEDLKEVALKIAASEKKNKNRPRVVVFTQGSTSTIVQPCSYKAAIKGFILGMGNPLLDISADVGQDVLDKYDVKLDSAILAEEAHMPIYEDLINNHNAGFIAGGATQNSIRIAQWMLKSSNVEDATAFMGCVGEDAYGKTLKECAEKDGVKTHYMIDKTTPTGSCAVLVKDGERSLIANLAAANNFKESHLESAESRELIEKATLYYIAGFFLTVSVDSLVIVAEHALANDKPFCLNLSAPFIIDFFGDQVATALAYADYLFCNESEAAAYAKKHD